MVTSLLVMRRLYASKRQEGADAVPPTLILRCISSGVVHYRLSELPVRTVGLHTQVFILHMSVDRVVRLIVRLLVLVGVQTSER